jgi:hypothetical protein
VKHISVIACVSAAGESLALCIVRSQDSPSVREQLNKHGVRFGTDLITKLNAKPSLTIEIFIDSVQTVFRPTLAELRRSDEVAEEMAVLLMDNCPSHITCVVEIHDESTRVKSPERDPEPDFAMMLSSKGTSLGL